MERPPPRRRVDVLGVGVDPVGPVGARRWITAALADGTGAGCRHVVTLNPEYVVAARRDREFARAIRAAELVVADGIGVVIAGRLLDRRGADGLHRVTGIDLCVDVTAACAQGGVPLFLLGGRGGAAEVTAGELSAQAPAPVSVAWWEGGSAERVDDAEALARIAQAGARVVLVAYGAPGQVLWIERNRAALGAAGVRIAIGVGGAFDVLCGRQPRAPRWVRRVGLEWWFRLVREPWRWRRQLALPWFAALVLLTAGRRRVAALVGRAADGDRRPRWRG